MGSGWNVTVTRYAQPEGGEVFAPQNGDITSIVLPSQKLWHYEGGQQSFRPIVNNVLCSGNIFTRENIIVNEDRT